MIPLGFLVNAHGNNVCTPSLTPLVPAVNMLFVFFAWTHVHFIIILCFWTDGPQYQYCYSNAQLDP